MDYQEFIKEYGEEEVKFSSYYKYSFIFRNEKLSVGYGGSADDIYRLEVDTEPKKVKEIEPSWARIGDNFYTFEW